jgi:hypothetical protein
VIILKKKYIFFIQSNPDRYCKTLQFFELFFFRFFFPAFSAKLYFICMDGKHGKPNAKIYRKHIDLIKDKLKFIWKFSVVPFFLYQYKGQLAIVAKKKRRRVFATCMHACNQ